MLTNIPLTIVPFIVYNLVALGLLGNASWESPVLSIPMMSTNELGETIRWVMTLGDLMITLGLFLLFFEIMKATRFGVSSVVDHLLSTFVFVAYLVEFLLVGSAAHSVFFILMVITFIDVIAGFSVSIRSATRDVTLGG